MGLLHTKCIFGLIWLTDLDFKHTLDLVYQAGVRNINLKLIVLKVAWPVVSILSLFLALPYIFFMGILHLSGRYGNIEVIYQLTCLFHRSSFLSSLNYCIPLLFSMFFVGNNIDGISSVWIFTV